MLYNHTFLVMSCSYKRQTIYDHNANKVNTISLLSHKIQTKDCYKCRTVVLILPHQDNDNASLLTYTWHRMNWCSVFSLQVIAIRMKIWTWKAPSPIKQCCGHNFGSLANFPRLHCDWPGHQLSYMGLLLGRETSTQLGRCVTNVTYWMWQVYEAKLKQHKEVEDMVCQHSEMVRKDESRKLCVTMHKLVLLDIQAVPSCSCYSTDWITSVEELGYEKYLRTR